VRRLLNSFARKLILVAAGSKLVQRFVNRFGMKLGAARFVAGQTLDEAVPVLRGLNDKGLATNTTILGEDVLTEAEANAVADQYIEVLERIAAENLRTNVALKLTHLGLDVGEEIAYANLRRVVTRARELDNFVRIDMEYSAIVDVTLRIYTRLREDGLANVGTVLQSYLFRTPDDLAGLVPLEPNLRLVKGAYLEPAAIAFQKKAEVDHAYVKLMETMLREIEHTAIATHDDKLIEHAIAFAEREGIPRERFEFQMLYGIRGQLQEELVARGYKVLVATPHGPDWFPYLMRRLAERPANLTFFLRSLFGR
jgi:proline dehydrogenase